MTIDFGKTAADYHAYRPPFAPQLFTRLKAMHIGLPNQIILDVGAGTGLLGQGLRKSGADVIECDVSVELLRQAGERSVASWTEMLPFADESFDAVTAGQCWHWFDRTLAPWEILRVLQPNGRIAIIYQTYLPIPGNVAAASEELILSYRPGWRHAGGVGINGQALKDLQVSGFKEIESFSFDIEIDYPRQAWQGFVRTCSAVGPSLPADELARFDREHAQMLEKWPTALAVPHRVFAAVATRP